MRLPNFVPRLDRPAHTRMMQINRRLQTLVQAQLWQPEDRRLSPIELRDQLWIIIWLAYLVGRTGDCPVNVLHAFLPE